MASRWVWSTQMLVWLTMPCLVWHKLWSNMAWRDSGWRPGQVVPRMNFWQLTASVR
jgi:hypothetical protein